MPKTSPPFEGIWTALWTPTNLQGKLLKKAVKDHILFLKKAGVQGLVVGGSTGEFIRLTLKQRQELLEYVMQHAESLPVLLNISDVVFDHVKALASKGKQLGVAGVLILPPSYYPVSQPDLIAYFMQVAELTDNLPFFLYNFPECVRNAIEIDTVAQLAEKITLAGIKHSGNDFDYHHDLVLMGRKKHFNVMTGADKRLPEAMHIGVHGAISGLANAIPELLLDIYRKVKQQKDPISSQTKVETIGKCLTPLSFPFDVMALMEARELETGTPKISRSPQSVSLQKHIVQLLKTLPLVP